MHEVTYVDRSDPLDTDPVGFLAYIVGLVESILLAVQVTWGVDEGVRVAVLGVVQSLVPLAAFVLARRHAWAPATVAKLGPEDVSTHPLELPVPEGGPPA